MKHVLISLGVLSALALSGCASDRHNTDYPRNDNRGYDRSHDRGYDRGQDSSRRDSSGYDRSHHDRGRYDSKVGIVNRQAVDRCEYLSDVSSSWSRTGFPNRDNAKDARRDLARHAETLGATHIVLSNPRVGQSDVTESARAYRCPPQ